MDKRGASNPAFQSKAVYSGRSSISGAEYFRLQEAKKAMAKRVEAEDPKNCVHQYKKLNVHQAIEDKKYYSYICLKCEHTMTK